jgi:hypothetical protein
MDPLAKTYRQAFEKQAFLGKAQAGLKAVGKGLGALPFWLGGSMIAEKVIGKKPSVRRVYVPRAKFEAMRRAQMGEQQPQGMAQWQPQSVSQMQLGGR